MKVLKTWGDIYHDAVNRGLDNGYAAWLADRWEKRKKNENHDQNRTEPPTDLGSGVRAHPGVAVVPEPPCGLCHRLVE
jgi:hypothetical protein